MRLFISVLAKIKKLHTNIGVRIVQIITIALLTLFISTTYMSFKDDLSNKISDITSNENIIVTQLISRTLNNSFFKVTTNHRNITTSEYEIKICDSTSCLDFNFLNLKSLIYEILPDHLKLSVHIEDKLLFTNTEDVYLQYFDSYLLNGKFNLRIGLKIKDNYIMELRKGVINYYKRYLLFVLSIFICLFYIHKMHQYLTSKHSEEMYLKKILNFRTEIQRKEWEIKFSKKKDLEINLLFMKSAQVITEQNVIDSVKKYTNTAYHKILLDQDELEIIALNNFKNDFETRFSLNNITSQNIKFDIEYEGERILFHSKALFYQIIYSLLIYVTFFITKELGLKANKISVYINGSEDSREISVNLPAMTISTKQQLLSDCYQFFITHANPFILDIRIIFSLLDDIGFNCIVKNNSIKITEKQLENHNSIGQVIEFNKHKKIH